MTEPRDAIRTEALAVAGGPLSDADTLLLRGCLARVDRDRTVIVGVDAGAAHLSRAGVVPDVITGDFDSSGPALRLALAERGARLVPTPDQDFTDLDKALGYLHGEGVLQVRVHGASGGRLDHLYSALSALIKYGRRMDVRLVDGIGETWLVDGEAVLTGPGLPGRTLSLLAFGPVTGVTTTGVRWPLHDEALAPGVRDGTLNRIVAETVRIRVGSGDLIVNVHHSDTEAS